MYLIPQFEQTVYLIPEYEVNHVLATASPFRGNFPTKEDIRAYLTKVNGALKERRDERKVLYGQYVTAVSIYTCVRPILHLNIPEKIPSSFITISKNKPYRINNPFEIIFTKNDEDSEPHIAEPLFNAQLASIEEEIPRNLNTTFTSSEFIKYKFARGLQDIANHLQHKYGERNHLLFASIKDICFPLLGMGLRGKEYHELSIHLQQYYGHLHLKVPLCLAPERENIA